MAKKPVNYDNNETNSNNNNENATSRTGGERSHLRGPQEGLVEQIAGRGGIAEEPHGPAPASPDFRLDCAQARGFEASRPLALMHGVMPAITITTFDSLLRT